MSSSILKIRLVFGNLDFQADVGMSAGPDEIELAPVRMALVLSSRRAGRADSRGGVTTVDGHMVDAPVLRLAQRTLAHARAA